MPSHLINKVKKIKKMLLTQGRLVEESLHHAISGIKHRTPELVQKVRDNDQQINQLEIDIDEECLAILAIHQPVAYDLRFIVTTLKINNSLERIGDLAEHIAEQTHKLIKLEPQVLKDWDLMPMTDAVRSMLQRALEAHITGNTLIATEVCNADKQVDLIYKQMSATLKQHMRENPSSLDVDLIIYSILRQVERIGDHCAHIAEETIYLVEGTIVRHTEWEFQDTDEPSNTNDN